MKDKLKCFFGFHKFGKWKEIENKGSGIKVIKRTCKRCGSYQEHEGFVSVNILDKTDIEPYVSSL